MRGVPRMRFNGRLTQRRIKRGNLLPPGELQPVTNLFPNETAHHLDAKFLPKELLV
jgi:hypothetical protein